MKLADVRSTYYQFSGIASDVTRKLDFAGIAVVWIFKEDGNKSPAHFAALIIPATWFVVSLLLDLLQYVYGAAAWSQFHRIKEKQKTPEAQEFKAPRWINWPTNAFFWGKIAGCLLGYGWLATFLLDLLVRLG